MDRRQFLLTTAVAQSRIQGANDRIRTGDGKDHVSGGPGQDSIATGRGNDRVEALDGHRDRVNCGPGKRDAVSADSFDILIRCEQRKHAVP